MLVWQSGHEGEGVTERDCPVRSPDKGLGSRDNDLARRGSVEGLVEAQEWRP
jgi:hypothetical protein